MKHLMATVLIALLLPLSLWAESNAVPRISLVEGEVMINTADSGEWAPASINTPLQEGDSLWCPEKARVEVQLTNGTLVRLDQRSQLVLLTRDNSFLQLHLAQGRMFVYTSTSKEQNLQIDADDTTVLPFGSTRLRIDMRENREEDVSIFKGAAYVEGNGNRTKVRAGEQIVLVEGRTELLPLNAPDAWEQWNSDRDRRFKQSYTSDSYLPDELRPYAPDFDANGTWVSAGEYGMVWRPAAVAADWAPYREGRWVWLRGDYVWISYESWGWAPHHYGRWIMAPAIGWCWIPPVRGDIYWSPGYVGWFSYGGSIGWVPLAPGEVYYGHGHYGRYSRNIAAIDIRTIKAHSDYRNLRHGYHGVTVVNQADFLRGKSYHKGRRHDVSLPPAAAIVGRPSLRPERETRMPMVRTNRPAMPEPSRNIPIHDLRQRFPRVVPQSRSAAPASRTEQPVATPSGTARPPHERHTDMPTRQTPSVPAAQPASRADHPVSVRPGNVKPQIEKRIDAPAHPAPSVPAATPSPARQPARDSSPTIRPQQQTAPQERKVWRVQPSEERTDDRRDSRQEQRGREDRRR